MAAVRRLAYEATDAGLRWRCREKGISVATPDEYVAKCGLDLNALVLTRDTIFSQIARHVDMRWAHDPHALLEAISTFPDLNPCAAD